MYASGVHTFRTIAAWLNQTGFRPRYDSQRTGNACGRETLNAFYATIGWAMIHRLITV
jgi:hypothetical protein